MPSRSILLPFALGVAAVSVLASAGVAGLASVVAVVALRLVVPPDALARIVCRLEGRSSIGRAVDRETLGLLDELAGRAGGRPPRLRLVTSPDIEAFALPGGSRDGERDVVMVSEGLVSLAPPERAAVLAHELGHLRAGHVPLLAAITLAAAASLLAALVVFLGHAPALDRLRASGVSAPIAANLFLVTGAGLGLLRTGLAPRLEWEADAWAAALLGSPDRLVAVLERRLEELDRSAARALVDERLARLAVRPS